jgi:protein-S-isoprenylcysteine O-methyltransferase Ste14
MDARSTALFRRAWPRQLIFVVLLAALLCGSAGTLSYWQGWLFIAVFAGSTVALGVYFVRHDPALIERRMKAGPRAEQEPTQKIIIALFMAGFFALIVLPAFDHRWHWSSVPAWLVIVADAGIVVSFVSFFVVMKQNSYAASTITVETNQPVISTGLYGVVRHPMYAAALLLTVSMPLALGSYWSLLLVIVLLPLLGWRLLDEERFLVAHLDGYASYRERVRYRLVPGVW